MKVIVFKKKGKKMKKNILVLALVCAAYAVETHTMGALAMGVYYRVKTNVKFGDKHQTFNAVSVYTDNPSVLDVKETHHGKWKVHYRKAGTAKLEIVKPKIGRKHHQAAANKAASKANPCKKGESLDIKHEAGHHEKMKSMNSSRTETYTITVTERTSKNKHQKPEKRNRGSY